MSKNFVPIQIELGFKSEPSDSKWNVESDYFASQRRKREKQAKKLEEARRLAKKLKKEGKEEEAAELESVASTVDRTEASSATSEMTQAQRCEQIKQRVKNEYCAEYNAKGVCKFGHKCWRIHYNQETAASFASYY